MTFADDDHYHTADLIDHFEPELWSCALQLHDFGGVLRFHGPARTLICQNDNLLLKNMLETPGNGAVLVVDGGGSLDTALIGDIIAGAGLKNGWAGVVINGAVRDCEALRRMPFGVKALGTNPSRSGKSGSGLPDVPVVIGRTSFAPGQWIYCDRDGVLVADRPVHNDLAK